MSPRGDAERAPGGSSPSGAREASLSALAVRRPIAALMLVLIVATLGLVSLRRLAVDLLPEFDLPTVTVFAPYPGVSSLEVESLVLEPLEEAVASVPGLESLTSTAREGAAVVRMKMAHGVNLLEALNDVRVAVERVRNRLPSDLEAPQVFRFDPNSFPIVYLSVTSTGDLREVTRVARDEVKPRLARIPGVAAIDIRGSFEREVRIELLSSRLFDLGIPIEQVRRAIVEENVDVSVGKVRDAGLEVGIRAVAAKKTAQELTGIPIATREGRVVTLGEVARVIDDTAELTNVVRVNGRLGLRLGVRKGPGSNTIEVAHRVYEELDRIQKDLPDVEIAIIMDQSQYVESAVTGARNAAFIGGLLAIAVLLIFLRSFRATLLVAIAIPSSVLASFIVMDRAEVSLNLMTLGGIALGVGMLVDNAVVVLESVVHHLQRGKSAARAAIDGASEVALAVAASTTTTIVIFVPVLFLDGINRVVYGQLALVVSSALVASLLVSLTIVPAFAGRLFAKSGLPASSGWLMQRLERVYARVLNVLLQRAWSTLGVLVGIALAAGAIIPHVETELMPATDEGQVVINVALAMGTPLEETEALVLQISDIAERLVPEADRVFMSVGSPGWWSSRTSEAGRISVTLPSQLQRPRPTDEVAQLLREAMPKAPGATIGVRTGGGMFLLRFLRGGSGEDRLEVKVRGQDLEEMGAFAKKVAAAMKDIPGIVDVREPQLRGRDEIAVRVDAERAGSLGLSAEAVGGALETYVRGRRVTRLRTAEEEVPVVLRLADEDRQRAEQIEKLLIFAPATGEAVAVGEIASFHLERGPVLISREEGARVLNIGAETEGRALGEVVKDVRAAIQAVKAPPGTRAVVGGEAAQSKKLFNALQFGALLALLLVFMVMAAQFESLIQPLLVMASVPFAGVGVLVLFGLSLSTLNMYSFMGMIVLVGIAVNNAIVLVDYTRKLRDNEGYDVARAVRMAASRRLRPILMTTATTLLGLLPVALSEAAGSELQGPLARVVVAGLLTATVVTLVLVPVLYMIVEGARERRG